MELSIRKIKVAIVIIYCNILYSSGIKLEKVPSLA